MEMGGFNMFVAFVKVILAIYFPAPAGIKSISTEAMLSSATCDVLL
jgi:hypothetical protein